MIASDDAGYILLDPRPMAANAPYTFFIPSEAELAAAAKGDLVQLMFEYTHETEKWSVERMWVTIEEVEGDSLGGKLENQPYEPTSPLQPGSLVSFERHQILAVEWANPVAAPEPVAHREYWERCLVDTCVLDGTEPIEFIYREVPDMAEEGDKHPDSGWRIRGRMGDATDEEIEARKAQYVAMGAVLNRDDSWLSLIDSPIGTGLLRDFDTDTYLEES